MKYKITHLTTHLGGGIGSVLWNWVKSDDKNDHTILCLNKNYYNSYDPKIVHENMRLKKIEIAERIAKSDIVVVHFWNHPYLFDFLVNADIPDCRLCLWSHVSGLQAPYVFSEKLIRFSDLFVFASPISYKAKEISALPKGLKTRLRDIWTTGNIDEFLKIKPIPHEGFNIGFIGTLDYSKLHPDFVEFCSKIDIPDVKFIICGGGCDEDKIKQQVKEKGLEDKFVFTGVIDDVIPYLAIIDVFGYPLNPNHFGTCEQVLGEAIAAGVIPIVMHNPAEEFIMFQSLVKFICNDEHDYINNIKLLYRDRNKRSGMIDLIRDSVMQLYDSKKMVDSWDIVFDEMIEKPKRKRVWPISNERAKMGGHGIFIESLGDYGKVFEKNNYVEIQKLFDANLQWHSSSKGSPRQYLNAFPDDVKLKEWVELLGEGT